MAIIFPDINSVALNIGSISIRWYGIAYVISIITCTYVAKFINKKLKITDMKTEDFDILITYIIIAIIIGGRLGHVLFYMPISEINLIDIFKIWLGGMSFHGGLTGVACAIFLYSKRYKKQFLSITDLIAIVTPIGLFFGRIANFINAELYGRVTSMPWGMIFPGTD